MENFKHYRPPSEKLDTIHHRRRYDVFVSFRGPDVRNTLVNKLFKSLQHEGLHVFLDSERLEKGENIGIGLEEAIKDSRLHIPIFSVGYAGSAWCLRELSLMWRCKATCAGTHIIPLFYHVEPWLVRYPDNEKSPYAEALKKHSENKRQSKEEIEEWKAALHQVSSLSGWALAETASSDEDKLVQQVTEDLQTYNIKDLHVAKHPVGLATRTIEVMKELLGIADHQRRKTFGIWGMGGSGKTTLSKSVYNHIHHMFQASCFVADIRVTARESAMGLRNLQKHVLKNLAKHNVDLYSVDQGKIEMQNRLASIRALVLLDDVDDDEHLDALLGDWYGPGSIIIITSRDKEVLQQRQVDKIQAMGGLIPEEGVKLFSWHAFGRESPPKDYENMTEQIVHACDGLPLSLEILGAHLRSERNLEIWKEALQKIQNVGYDKLYKSLRISYDALTFHEKQIFLDIACFFIVFSRLYCFSKEFYVKFWEALRRTAVYTSLKNLEGKSLIVMHEYTNKYTRHGQIACEFRMHEHLRDLGRQIVDEESPDNPHMRSRLWHKEDITSAIDQAEETSTVQGIMWRGRVDFEVEQVDSLSSMHNLKFMFCWDLFLKREITKLPQNLRYLVLSECKLKQHRSFSEMPSSTESYWSFCFSMPKAIGQLKYLRYLDMSGTPLGLLPIEFGQLLSLEELYLIRCSLIELPHSFGNLIKLKFLDISENWLKSFPANFSQLRSLQYLDARRNQLEELSALPECLVHLDVRYCARLHKLSSISHITHLHTIKLWGCESLYELPKIDNMHSLTKLRLDGCENLKELPSLPRSLASLTLKECYNLQSISCMRHMKNLERILLFECASLSELPELEALQSLKELGLSGLDINKLPILPSGLIHLTLLYCSKMQKLPCMSHMRDLETIDLSECRNLVEIPKLDSMHSLRQLILDDCWNLEKLPVLPAGPIHVSTFNCFKLQNNSSQPTSIGEEDEQSVSEEGTSSTDKRKHRSWESNHEIPVLDLKRHRVTKQSILDALKLQVGEQGTSSVLEEMVEDI